MMPPTLEDLKTMISVRFPEGNGVIYGQDFAYYKGVPWHHDWYISRAHNGLISLVAPGYGVKGDYGNGCVHVRIEHLVKKEYES